MSNVHRSGCPINRSLEVFQEHLGIPAGPSSDGSTVRQCLQDSYLAAVASNRVVSPPPSTPGYVLRRHTLGGVGQA
jgi:hypothetical protein